ncbi:HD domain-containing phosphohydrolase [Vibrio sinaloensis]|uniref:HD domain-containing phosphohydrolase n=1 Tax=Photobacterium sp. (strain ATCC 43367) TaxID=379097 RepID=UPI0020564D9A|nr:HD domain-containing phosphohydrolase [Vibrio sinaloensis]UPQ89763.1 metal-dependent phosphohydrolase [Vibrio sinaloensis]
MKKQRYSLSMHITTLFLVLTSLVGVVLIAISYQHAQQLLTSSAKELSRENSRKLESTFQVRAGPIFTTLDFMALSDSITNFAAPSNHPRFWRSLQLIFERNPGVVALFYVNEQGDFTIARELRSSSDYSEFDAPLSASIMVNVALHSGSNEFFFLDKNLEQVGYRNSNDNTFDPRNRSWYQNAAADGLIRLSEPYAFYFLKTTGVTLSRRSADGKSVVGADFTLSSLSEQLSQMGYSSNTQLMLFDDQFEVLGHHNTGLKDDQLTQPHLSKTVFASVLNRLSSQILYETPEYQQQRWSVTLTPVQLNSTTRLLLAEATPQDDLLRPLLSLRDKQVTVAMVLLSLSFVVVWFVAKRLAQPLQALMHQTDNIARFDFKKTRYSRSMIKEVANLTKSIELMEHTLFDLLRLLRETASNQDFSVLAKTIAHQSFLVTRAETIVLFTKDEKQHLLTSVANHAIIPFKIDINTLIDSIPWVRTELKKGEIVHLNRDDVGLAKFREQLYNSDVYLFPLHNREKALVGVLLLGYERAITPEQSDKHAFLKELLSFGEIAKENIDRIEQQKEMLNAFVELIASAIDTKSPYTGSHCQRVPELTKMLVTAADKDKQYFPIFSMSKDQWEALHLASWLHDCGKVTTPEYVIDKATKLETIYDRIHEIRMRFELLKSQAEIEYWQGIAGGGDEIQLKQALSDKHQQLDDDFAFIGQCNIGSESMSDEAVERLKRISQYTWTRTLDDQIGVSWIEKQRAGHKAQLPVQEPLLSDKPVHFVTWQQDAKPQDIWQETFVLTPGELKYNRGELYNLSVTRGTLNDEERFIINDHIIQTIMMLNRLPYPEHLKQVPEYACGHHERMDGKGYPRGLSEEQLSIPARVMAIADVFEALTSSDRPYKKGKTLSESVDIMTDMAISGHIDPKLYLLFLEQEIDQSYAKRFLNEEQQGSIDRAQHILRVKSYLRSQF